jgi:c-di-GMP phosphodiesterase
MKSLKDFAARWTLGKLLALLAVLSLFTAMAIIFVLSSTVRDREVKELARQEAQQTSMLVFQSLYSAMRKGWSKQEITGIIERLNETFSDMKINVYRGEIVSRQFGEMAGEHAVIEKDAALQRALVGGQDSLTFVNDDTARYLYPVVAKQECLVCHTQSHIGAVHGVIDVTYPIKGLTESFAAVINPIVAYALLVMGAIFFLLYLQLRYLIVLPIDNLLGVMRKVTLNMDLSQRVNSSSWSLELKQLTEYFNHLLKTIQDNSIKLEELSVRDPLTGLYNRRKFQEFMQNEIIRATRHDHGFSVIMIDLDNFKSINDTFGHPVGDMVLKEVTTLFGVELRRLDVLARLGGDEFAIILPETDVTRGMQVANKVHQALAEKVFELPVGQIRVTASFSMVSFPEDAKTEEEIYSAMDVVLYKAKANGKNQVMTAGHEEDHGMMKIFKQGEFLRSAAREGRIEAFLQPIVNVQSGDVMAYEVLGRIRNGEKFIPAEDFAEVAEDLGMAQDMDREVFRKGLEHYKAIVEDQPQVKLFFNLFPSCFKDIEWVRGIPDLVRSVGVPCECVVLEITEREALPNLTKVGKVIEELRANKISVALDDFGSGFSSFMYLKHLAIDYVKIEGSFIRQIVADDRDRIMVEHINSIAHQFGLKTVAEFVEDEQTAKIIAEIGVDYAQGYYYGYPALPK